MRRSPLAVLALLVLAGCSGAPAEPAKPGPRVIQESQVRVFTDRVIAKVSTAGDVYAKVLAESPDRAGGQFPDETYRGYIENMGRAICSHVIAGETPQEAFRAAYPKWDIRDTTHRVTVELAPTVLCPAT